MLEKKTKIPIVNKKCCDLHVQPGGYDQLWDCNNITCLEKVTIMEKISLWIISGTL